MPCAEESLKITTMAIFHCQIQNIKRSQGRSAVAKSAYNSRCKLKDERTGKTHNYSKKSDLGFSKIFLPKDAPTWASDRQKLWAAVEKFEKRKDAVVAKEIEIALPIELNLQQQIELISKFIEQECNDLGMVADVNFHQTNPNLLAKNKAFNPHAHILLTTRPFAGENFGNKERAWDKKNQIKRWRKAWANLANRALAQSGSRSRIDHRSLKEQKIDRIPQIHLGAKASAMMKKNLPSPRAERYQKILNSNAKKTQERGKRYLVGLVRGLEKQRMRERNKNPKPQHPTIQVPKVQKAQKKKQERKSRFEDFIVQNQVPKAQKAQEKKQERKSRFEDLIARNQEKRKSDNRVQKRHRHNDRQNYL